MSSIYFLQTSSNLEFAPTIHGVPGINCQVEKDLLNHACIAFDTRQFGSIFKININAESKNHPLQHLAQLMDHIIEIQSFGSHFLLATEGEQLPGQFSGAGCCVCDLLNRINNFCLQLFLAINIPV